MSGGSEPETLAFSSGWPPAIVIRRPTSRLSLRLDAKGEIRISAPRHLSRRQIADFVNNNEAWLTRQKQRSQQMFGELAGENLGPELSIQHLPGQTLGARSLGSVLSLTHPADFADWPLLYQAARPTIKRLITSQAKAPLLELASGLAGQYNFELESIKTRWMRSRWGSCNNRGVVTLNSQLIRLPLVLRRYVILHEFTHLAHQHHQADFWQALIGVAPEAKVQRRELKSYPLWY